MMMFSEGFARNTHKIEMETLLIKSMLTVILYKDGISWPFIPKSAGGYLI